MLDETPVGTESGLLLFRALHPVTGKSRPLIEVSADSNAVEDSLYLGRLAAVDGDYTTAWREGIEGPGEGQSVTLSFAKEPPLIGLSILPGFCRTPELWSANNSPRRLLVEADAYRREFELPEGAVFWYLDLEGTVREGGVYNANHPGRASLDGTIVDTDSLTLTILDVYPGELYDDTCITEIAPGFAGPLPNWGP